MHVLVQRQLRVFYAGIHVFILFIHYTENQQRTDIIVFRRSFPMMVYNGKFTSLRFRFVNILSDELSLGQWRIGQHQEQRGQLSFRPPKKLFFFIFI